MATTVQPLKVDLRRVWPPHQGLSVSRRNRRDRTNPAPKYNWEFRCPAVCGRCVHVCRGTGRRCRKRTCVDFRLCMQHLVEDKHLYIGQRSRHLQEDLGSPIEGRGLYAVASASELRRAGVRNGIPNETDTVVFRKGQEVDTYSGERMSKRDLDARYVEDDVVARYTVSADSEVKSYRGKRTSKKWRSDHGTSIDALCASTAASYANDPMVPGDQRSDDANVTIRGSEFAFKATRDIRHGEEIMFSYGNEYWE